MTRFFTHRRKGILLFLLQFIFTGTSLLAQETRISDYVIFSGDGSYPGAVEQRKPARPGCSVQLGSLSYIQGGSVGSYGLIKSTGNVTFESNIYSRASIYLSNNNTISGRISAANIPDSKGSALLIGAGASIKGNIDVNGDILVKGGTVDGIVTHPEGSSYLGPIPSGGERTEAPQLTILPALPAVKDMRAERGLASIYSTTSIEPGSFGNVALRGNQTLTLSGGGTYIFNQIDNKGGSNAFVFDFKNDPSAVFKIYVHEDVDLGKIKARMINGGSAERIYMEVHGNGSSCGNREWGFNIDNGYSILSGSTWFGTVWVPYASINIGSGFGHSSITGALWSGVQVNVQCGAKISYAPFSECSSPGADAGPDKSLNFENQTSLEGSSPTAAVTYKWEAINGGVIATPADAATITVSAAGDYILTVTKSEGCSSKDTAIVTGKRNDLIGSELRTVFENFDPNAPPSPFFLIQHDSIMIDVIALEGQYDATLQLLTTPEYGLTNILSNGSSNFIITGLFPIAKLPSLNELTSLIVYVRPYYAAVSKAGIATTAGDVSMRTSLVRDGYQLQGEGVKIGVISDSYNTIQAATTNPLTNTAAQDIINGDLPGTGNPNGDLLPVNVLQDFPLRRSDEGRAMLQIIHDIAPKAELYFRTGFFSAGDFAQGIEQLNLAGCHIIVDDVTFITEPFLKDGVIATAVDAVAATGTTYFSAAGNFANKSYESDFNPVPAPGGLSGTAHNFGGNDVFQNVSLTPGNYTIVLQWMDDIYSLGQTATGGTKNDLDIYLTPNTNGTALFGFNRNNTNGDPIEILPFTLTEAVNTNILITNNTLGSNPARIKFIVFRGDITFNEYASGTSTIVGQANAAGAIAVGAVRYDKAPPFAGPLAIETFSSIGGTLVNNVQRNKPEFTAPDGVNTTVNLGADYDNNSLSNFFGTSAAAPHAAAVAALVMEGRRRFLDQPTTSPAEIRSILQSSAIDMNAPGFDFSSGYGFINADSAMRTFANPLPSLIQLVIPPATVPGEAPFTLTVTGTNLSPNSVVQFRGEPLPTTVVNSSTATTVIPAFFGNPAISVFTPPISSSSLDGGYSDSLYFFDPVKKQITVTANPQTKKYAEALPVFTATVLVDSMALERAGLTLEQLGLTTISYNTSATSNSNVGTYIVTPSRTFDPADSIDVGLLEKYNYQFVPANLTIQKMPLTVTPEDKTVYFGEHIGEISYHYEFDHTRVPDPEGVLNLIKAYHQAFLPNNVLAIVQGGTALSPADLANLNMMASFKAVNNARKFTLEDNKLVPAVNPNSFNIQYLVDVSAQSILAYKNSPATASFINAFPGISSKALLSAAALAANTAQVLVNGSLVQMVNGSLVQMVNSDKGPLAPILNGSLVQIVNGSLVQLVNGEIVPVANGSLVQLVNGSLVQLVNSELVPLPNGSLVQLVNGSLVQLVNGSLVQLVNGQQVPIINGSLVQLVNGSLVQLVNGVPVPIPNGSLVQLVNGSLVQMVNGSLVQLVNGSLVQLVNGSLVQLVNGSLVQLVNGSVVGADNPNNNTAVIIDQTDVDFQANWIGPMFSVNMITGLSAGLQKLVPGMLSNENFEISYAFGNVNILPKTITIQPDAGQTKIYGSADPVFTFTNDAGLSLADFSGKLGRVSGNNVGEYAYTLGNLSAGPDYVLQLSSASPLAKFSITPKLVDITPVPGQCKTYGDPDPVIRFTNNAGLSADDYTGALSREAGNKVGDYNYLIGTLSAGNNYTLRLVCTSSFLIKPAPLLVTVKTTVIFKGDRLPDFESTITGLKYSDRPAVSYTLSPNCVGQPGVYTITPSLRGFPNLFNYVVKYVSGKLYINPKGPDAKPLYPYLECVEESSPGKYIAHFVCFNKNRTPVYVAPGTDNNVSSPGAFSIGQQPFVFEPGTTRYDVEFDGNTLYWKLRTYDCYDKKLITATAGARSKRCGYYTSARPANAAASPAKPALNGAALELAPASEAIIYPSPAVDKAIVYVTKEQIRQTELSLYDTYGRQYPVRTLRQVSEHAVEFDVSRLAGGLYFMRVKVKDGYKTISIVKQ